MKKLAIMAALAIAAVSASALEVGVRGSHSASADISAVGVSVGQKFGAFGVEAALDRTTRGAANLNKWSLVGSYDVVKLGPVALAAKAGVATLDPSVGPNGGAWLVGVGASYPLAKNVSLTADYYYQKGQNRVRAADGNYFSGGVKFAF
jgi:predicted porin